MIKNHRLFFLTNSINLIILVLLSAYSYILNKDLDILYKKHTELTVDLHNLNNRLFVENSLDGDLLEASNEKNILFSNYKNYKNYWDSFLSSDENIFINHTQQSAHKVDAFLTMELTKFKKRCLNNSIKLNTGNRSVFKSEIPESNEFGFGFSPYIGTWPSFDKEEAGLIEIQTRIIDQIVDAVASSSNEGELIELLYIKRESVGNIDAEHIGSDMVSGISDALLLKSSALVNSFRFQVSFVGRTENARSFVNQLRPPFSIRKIEARRSAIERDDTDEPVNDTSDVSLAENNSQILPIIRDIKTKFIIDLEYVYELFYKPSDFAQWSGLKHSKNKQILELVNNLSSK